MSVDAAIAAIPRGWRIYMVDMSIDGRANVSLRGPAYLNEEGVSIHEYVGEIRATLDGAIAAASDRASRTYRGWLIHQGRWPEPAWMATGPNYDASYEGEEDGFVDNGEKADAPTHDALIAEIDAWFEENSAAHPEGAPR